MKKKFTEKRSKTKKTDTAKKKLNLSIPILKFKKQNRSKLILQLVVLACVILLGASLYVWWTRIMINPDRVLQDTLANNLSTRTITKTVEQSGPTGGIDQTTALFFYPPSIQSQTDTVLTQGIGSAATSVATQTIGTPDSDFVRYTSVKGGNSMQGVDNLKGLLGIWAKRQQNLAKGQQVSFLNESLFGVMPFGYFNQEQKTQLLQLINQKNLYKYISAKKSIENKRLVYTYDMSINPADLVSVLHDYIKLGGAGDASQLDPSQYAGIGDVKIKLTIDILSRQILRVEYSTGRVENYSGQNLYHPINIPEQTIPVEELQKRLQGQSA